MFLAIGIHWAPIDKNLRSSIVLATSSSSGLVVVVRYSCGTPLSIGSNVLVFFVVASLVLSDVVEQVVDQNAKDQEEPEEIDRLETGKQPKRNILTDPALVLLCLPVQLKRPNGAELGENCPDNLQVDVVSQVNPHRDKKSEIGASD